MPPLLASTLLFIVFSTFIPPLHGACNPSDEKALLAFKNGDEDRRNILSDWGKTGTSCCTWRGITCQSNRVTSISLQSLALRGELPRELGDLSQLQTLNLFDNVMDGALPPELGKLLRLQVLNLGSNFFSGTIPSSFTKLSSTLQVLDLTRFRFTGPSIPGVIGKLGNLKSLVLSSSTTDGEGSIPSFLGDLKGLTYLSLNSITSLTGSIPNDIAKLTRLQTLDLSGCMKLTGSIPQFLGAQLGELENLDLSGTSVSGSVPTSLSKLSKLKHLDISSTKISGKLPEEFGSLVSLEKLRISETRITGSIPGTFGNLKQLKSLDLSKNSGMRGGIPEGLGQLSLLEELDLSGSGVSGRVPDSFGQLKSLIELRINDNSLSGSVPGSLGLLSKLKYLYAIGNKLSGRIPDEFARNLTSLKLLQLSDNLITGIPKNMANLKSLETFYLENNSLSFDSISGLATLPQLSSLELRRCGLKGPIPGWMRRMKLKAGAESVMRIDMAENEITGDIPSEFGELAELETLYLESNKLSGKVPDSVGKLSKLVFLDLSSNLLTGIPGDLSHLGVGSLYKFDLSNNKLTSFNEITGLASLSRVVFLGLSSCGLKGPIPDWFSSIRIVQQEGDSAVLEMDSNHITGAIPASFSRFSQLTHLFLQNNQMSGQIPASLSAMENLRSLDLSNNRFTGGIPAELLKLTWLHYFNVSSNHLQGKIPEGPPLSAMGPSSFANNPGLCGAPLPACK